MAGGSPEGVPSLAFGNLSTGVSWNSFLFVALFFLAVWFVSLGLIL